MGACDTCGKVLDDELLEEIGALNAKINELENWIAEWKISDL